MSSIREMIEYELIPRLVKEKMGDVFAESNKIWRDIIVEITGSASDAIEKQFNNTLRNSYGADCKINIPKTTWLEYDFDAIIVGVHKSGKNFIVTHHYPDVQEKGDIQYGVAFLISDKSGDYFERIYFYALVYNPDILEGKKYAILVCDEEGYGVASKGYGFNNMISLDEFIREAIQLIQGDK